MALTRGTATFTNGQQAVTGASLDAGSLTYFTVGTEVSVGADPVIRTVEAAGVTGADSFNLSEPWPHDTGSYYFLASNTSEQLVSVVRDATALKDALQNATEGFGTAAGADLQTNFNDATAGRVLTVGAFGIGSAGSIGNFLTDSNLNDLTVSGMYYLGGNPTNVPPDAISGGHLIVNSNRASGDSQVCQILTDWNDDKTWIRRRQSSVWQSWIEIWTSANFIYAQNQSGISRSTNQTVSGSNLNPPQSKTWVCVSNGTIENNDYGLWQKV